MENDDWTREETDHLFELSRLIIITEIFVIIIVSILLDGFIIKYFFFRQFDRRFVIMFDRYDIEKYPVSSF